MKAIRIIFITTIFFLKGVTPLLGQANIDIGEVIIEDEAMAVGRQIRMNSVTGKIVVTRRDLLSFGYSTAGDVIKNLPLVYLDSDPGVNRNVSIAGLDREFQAVLVNGIKPAGGEDARDLKLDRIPVSMIDRIEIDYNSIVSETADGAAGTLNIILKDEVSKEGYSFHAATDLHSTTPGPGIKLEAGMEKSLKWGDLVTGLSWSNYSRHLETTLEDSSTGINGGSVDDIKTSVFAANLGYKAPMKGSSTLGMHGFFSWFEEDESELADVKRRKDGSLNIRNSNTTNDKLRYLLSYDINYAYTHGNNRVEARAGYSLNFEQRHKDQLSEKSEYNEVAKEYEDQDNYSLFSELKYTLSNIKAGKTSSELNVLSGITYNNRTTDRFNASKPEDYLLWDVTDESYRLDETIAFLAADMRIKLTERFDVVPSMRYEYSFGAYTTVTDKGNHLYSHLSPSLNFRYMTGDKNIITAGAGRHISRPAFMSMVPVEKIKINRDVIEEGNPDLKPAMTNSFSMGDTWYYSDKSHVSITAYYKYVRDMINLAYTGIDEATGYNIYLFQNIDTARLYGFYIDARTYLGNLLGGELSFYSSYSYLGSRVHNKITGKNVRIDNQPENLVTLKIDYLNTHKGYSLSLSGNYNSHRLTNPVISTDGAILPAADEDGYLEIAARIKIYIRSFGSIYISGDNLIASPVKITQGSVSEKFYPGATFRAGINLLF